MLSQVPGSLFNIAQLLKYLELRQCCLSGSAASFEIFGRGVRGHRKGRDHTVRWQLQAPTKVGFTR
jgi:hypothetical protein